MSLVKIIKGRYQNKDALENEFNYCLGSHDEADRCEYWSGHGAYIWNPSSAINDMKYIKWIYGKEDGKQLMHMVVSIYRYLSIQKKEDFAEKEKTEQLSCDLLADEVSMLIFQSGYQNCYFKHIDTDYVHLHYIVNSVGYRDGKKLANEFGLAKHIFSYLDENYHYLQWVEFYK